ncbi:regulatory protein GemA [Marivibrio halodurans]|uniref:Regulatory protein GemA n=1 Tax=Marivibrio halodurans TaxID=2039722 RepID=A0A8J7RZ71_9PROT|nr:regulatory protein GemA [Marivibrio halodurans]
MTAAATKETKADAQRRGLYATISIGCKDLSIDDDARRDMIAARYGGRRSMSELSIVQLEDLRDHLIAQGFEPKRKAGARSRGPARAGARALADAPEARKARALWISLYHLGVVRNPAEDALAAFGKRQTGTDALQWIKQDWHLIIEALKKMAERDAGVSWEPLHYYVRDPETGVVFRARGPHARLSVLHAQWRIAKSLGAVQDHPHVTLEGFGRSVTGKSAFQFYEDADLDKLIEALGRVIRKAKAEGAS